MRKPSCLICEFSDKEKRESIINENNFKIFYIYCELKNAMVRLSTGTHCNRGIETKKQEKSWGYSDNKKYYATQKTIITDAEKNHNCEWFLNFCSNNCIDGSVF